MRNITRVILVYILSVHSISLIAQSMSDNQVIQYVMEQKEKGKSQQTIANDLSKKGVTQEQLVRIRNKYEAQNSLLGADNVTGQTTGSSKNRLRTKQEVSEDNRNKKQNYMVRSNREEKELKNQSEIERSKTLNKEIDFFDIDSLLYFRTLLQQKKVFGRDIFNNTELSFEPSLNIATPDEYILGPGDVVFIDVWGASQQTLEGAISPDGVVTFEDIGPVHLAGMKIKDANDYIKSKLGSYFADCEVSLSLGETRSIIVQVLGEVTVPGTYTISSLATAFNALYAAGGIGEVGTLRDIKVFRNGREISTIDVYDFLVNGNNATNVALQDNDVILVGAYDCLVSVQGRVKRPMYFEMKPSESLEQLVKYAGGFTGDAYTKYLRVIRKAGEEYSIHTVKGDETGSFLLSDCDSVYVDSIVARFSNLVEIRGAVKHPGEYELSSSISTVRQLVEVAGGLTEDAFIERAVMHREKDDLTLEMVAIDLQGIIEGSADDVVLCKNDVMYVPNNREMSGNLTYKINGEIKYPGTYVYADKTTVKDLILQAGGLTRAASVAKIDVFRRKYDPSASEISSERSEVYSFNLENGFVLDEDTLFYLMPDDEVQVRRSPVYNKLQNVRISGFVNFEGEYSITTSDFRLSDLVQMAGGLSNDAYIKGARLIRQMNEEELERREKSLKKSHVEMYEEQLSSKQITEATRELADTLLIMKRDLGDDYDVAIDLQKAMDNPKSEYDVVLRDEDHLIIPEINSTVKISGDVMYPTSVSYSNGKNMRYYIRNAGGFGRQASKSQTYVIYMNGSVSKIGRRAASSKIEPGCEIVIPSKPKKQGLSATETISIATSVASLATMVVALINMTR